LEDIRKMTNPIKKLIIRDLIRDQIKRIAIEARREAEEKLGTDLSARCYEANSILADKLRENGFRARLYDGFFRYKGQLRRHFYVIADGRIVDIAADQYGQDKIVVADLDDPRYE